MLSRELALVSSIFSPAPSGMKRDPKITSRIMAAIKSRDTEPERMLGRAMWALGLRYRKSYNLPGKPDFALTWAKIAVFCDGDFWHGNNWSLRGYGSLEEELSRYTDFWAQKIMRNIERDKRVDDQLSTDGWTVVRFWESDIRRDADACAQIVRWMWEAKRKSV